MGIKSFFRQIRGYGDNPKSKTKIPMLRLWGDYWLSSQNANRSDTFKKLRKTQYTDGSYLYSDTKLVSSFYTIDEYPTTLIKDYRETIRSCSTSYPKVRVSFIENYESDTINWESPQVKAKLKTWEVLSDEEAGQTTAYNMQEKVVGNEIRGHREESLIYLSKALKTRGRHLFRVRAMMVITGDRGEMYDRAVNSIMEHCQQIGLVVTKVEDNLEGYMRSYSPFSLAYQSSINREVGNPTMTDEILAQTYSYTQGKVGEKGKYWGMDVESGFPVLKEVKEDPKDPENILFTGQTGSGKSFFAKAEILQLLADSRFYGTIMDFEGTEYGPLVQSVKHGETNKSGIVVLNMGAGTGSYFDPVPICQINVRGGNADVFTEENNPYQMAKEYTNSLMSVLCCREKMPDTWEENIINEAIQRTYRDANVTARPETWVRSQNLTINNVYVQIKRMYEEAQGYVLRKQNGVRLTTQEDLRASDEYVRTIRRMLYNLQSNLVENKETYFSNPIRLEDISTAKLVVCSFGMLGRAPDSVPPTQMALMSTSAAIISHIRSLYSKAQGKLNFKVWEEFQRWSVLPGSVKTIKTALTGGRKLGDVNIIITNDLKSILLQDDFALLDNLTTMAIGLIGDAETRNLIMEKWPELEPMRGSLDRIASTADAENHTKKKGLTSGKYDKAFLLFLDRKVATVSKMYLPDGLAMSDIFKTAVEVDTKNKQKKRKGRS